MIEQKLYILIEILPELEYYQIGGQVEILPSIWDNWTVWNVWTVWN